MKFLPLISALFLAATGVQAIEITPEGAQLTLKAPATVTSAIVDGAVWQCEGNRCAAASVPGSVPALYACQHVVRELGAVDSFTYMGKAFSAEKLARCNAVLG